MCGCNKFKPASSEPKQRSQSTPTVNQVNQVNQETVLPTIDTSIWGPPLWIVLHTASLAKATHSRTIMSQWRDILNALRSGLPCPDCSAHYNLWFKTHPLRYNLIPLRGSNPIVRWMLDLHNDVNLRTGRSVWTIEQLESAYRSIPIADTINSLNFLHGKIGDSLFSALSSLLTAL